jgi:hypothetical protein
LRTSALALIALLIGPGLVSGQEEHRAWRFEIMGRGGLYAPVRDLGKGVYEIPGQGSAQFKMRLQPAPMFGGGVEFSTPNPKGSVRASLAYTSSSVEAENTLCDILTGEYCYPAELDASVLVGSVDILFHPANRNQVNHFFLLLGVGARRYSFAEEGCEFLNTGEENLYCPGLKEFVKDGNAFGFRIGFGLARTFGPVRGFIEIVDNIGGYEPEGSEFEGEIQSDVEASIGISFPIG